MLLKLFQKIARGGNTPKFIFQGHHYPDTKTRQKHYRRRKVQASISDKYRCKNPQQNISKLNSTIYKKDHTPRSSEIYSMVIRVVQHLQINVTHHINKRKGKNHMIISIDLEKAFEKIQHPFMIKILIKVGRKVISHHNKGHL